MIHLNYNNLDADTQAQLLASSKKEMELQFGTALKSYAKENGLQYDDLLEEEAIRNLYNYKYTFTV